METLPTKNNSNATQLATISKSTTAVLLSTGKFDELASEVPYAINRILDRPPITELKRQLPPEQHKMIEAFLARQIQLLVESVNVSMTIEPHQIPFIARELLQLFPTESLEDFVLCFRRGAFAYFGPIYNRLDASVLVDWMKKYLDEKYQLIEAVKLSAQVDQAKEIEINYQAYRDRVANEAQPKKKNNILTNEYERQRLANPYKYHEVRGIKVMATSQEHAEQIVKRMLELGELIDPEQPKE
jgi:hypothetical protein